MNLQMAIPNVRRMSEAVHRVVTVGTVNAVSGKKTGGSRITPTKLEASGRSVSSVGT
jgi:hypothetical protein